MGSGRRRLGVGFSLVGLVYLGVLGRMVRGVLVFLFFRVGFCLL